jgi:quinol monooxygenase YgiN
MAVQLQLDRFCLQVTIYIKESDVPKFFEYMKPVFDHVTAEPECLYFELFQDPTDPGTISWVENWDKSPEKFMSVC